MNNFSDDDHDEDDCRRNVEGPRAVLVRVLALLTNKGNLKSKNGKKNENG